MNRATRVTSEEIQRATSNGCAFSQEIAGKVYRHQRPVVIGPDRTQEVRASHYPQPATGVDLDPRRLAAPVRCDDGHDDRRDGKQTTLDQTRIAARLLSHPDITQRRHWDSRISSRFLASSPLTL